MNKTLRTSALALIIGLALPLSPFAQFEGSGRGGGDSAPAGDSYTEFKFNPKTRIKLDFRNSNIDLVLSMYQKVSGIAIVKDPSLTGAITLTSPTPVTLKTGFAILAKTLDLKGYDLKKDGDLMVIRKREVRQNSGFQMPSFDPSMFSQPQSKLKIYPIKFANATQVARVINEVFAQQQQSNPLAALFGGGQGGGRGGFGGGGQGGQGRGGFGGGGGGFGGGGFGGGGFGRGQQSSSVRASSDDFSNSCIVNAPDTEQKQVADIIKQIDKETDQPQRTKVFKLEYATAQEVAPTVQNVLTNNAPRGRGGAGAQNTNVGDRFQQALRFGSATASFGTVAADARTNSLVVTATEESLLILETVVKELDKEVKFASTTYVFPLNNARASDVAILLNQAFGQRAGGGRAGGNTQTPGAQRQNNNNNARANQPRGANIDGADPNNMQLAMQDPNATEGELLTSIGVAQGGGFGQFFGGGGGGGGNRQNQNQTTQTGRDANGKLVPVRDLTGQITAIADPNTNSIIIVGNPDSAALVKQILEQLDRIPEQVMIETLIVEATLDETNKLGVEWNYTDRAHLGTTGQTGTIGTNFGQATSVPALTGFRYTIGGANLTAFVNAIQTNSKFQILSTPRIFTSNNVQAQINISQSIPFVTNTRQDVNGGVTFNYAFQDVGVVLTVTPRITANGYVTMEVNQTANDLQGFTDFDAPIINQREADTTVSVKNGETIVLGGIIRNTVSTTRNKVPLLGDIPLLGQLFRSDSRVKNKTELIIMLTPRVVHDEDDARKLRIDTTNKLSKESQGEVGKVIPPESTQKEVKDNKKGGGN